MALQGGSELPEAAGQRLGGGAWSSGLSVADFAACSSMGLRPVALVQGFCAMQWGWYTMRPGLGGGRWGGMGGPGPGAGGPGGVGGGGGPAPYAAAAGSRGYDESWPCPHGIASLEHQWGGNYEQAWVETAWAEGFGSAYRRMVEEAEQAGAHGIIDVVDDASYLAEQSVVEFHVTGTAVAVEDHEGDVPSLWSTYLAGQRLAKLFEAGLAPVSVAAGLASVVMWPNCQTEFLLGGGGGSMWVRSYEGEIVQATNAEMAARDLVRSAVSAQLGSDILHGARFSVSRRAVGGGGHVIECTLRGTRVRRFKDFDPLPPPTPTVRLS
jgi:uncharacterized protein YbjQ (UPF0145 family)